MDTSAQSLQKPLGPGVLKRRILKVPAFMPSWTQLAVSFRLPVRSVTVGSTGLGVPQGPLQFDTDWTSHGCGVTSNPYRRGRTTCPHVCERSSPSTHYTTTRRWAVRPDRTLPEEARAALAVTPTNEYLTSATLDLVRGVKPLGRTFEPRKVSLAAGC